jgi:uncharacterized membrane protein YeaQ/YmgE (transglycosylase-associated protein family)
MSMLLSLIHTIRQLVRVGQLVKHMIGASVVIWLISHRDP